MLKDEEALLRHFSFLFSQIFIISINDNIYFKWIKTLVNK